MRRVGAEPEFALTLAESIRDRESLHLGGIWTHCAVADDPKDPFSIKQLSTFDNVIENLAVNDIQVDLCHAANSALALNFPVGRYGMVRCGIATYGIHPNQEQDSSVSIRPAMSLRSEVSFVKNI